MRTALRTVNIFYLCGIITVSFMQTGSAHYRFIILSKNDSTSYQLKKENLSTFERSFKPSFYDTEVYLFKKNDSTKINGTAIDQITLAPPETLQGYRIQLLATTNYDEALSLRNSLSAKYPDMWIYTEYESPAYKIRVGDFINKTDAKSTIDLLTQQGFKNTWIVPDKIIKNQRPKPPLPSAIDSTSIGN